MIVLLASCAADPLALPAQHPANPHAPVGQLAGAPASLRPGVIAYPDVPVGKPAEPAHHHHM